MPQLTALSIPVNRSSLLSLQSEEVQALEAQTTSELTALQTAADSAAARAAAAESAASSSAAKVASLTKVSRLPQLSLATVYKAATSVLIRFHEAYSGDPVGVQNCVVRRSACTCCVAWCRKDVCW